MIKKIVWLVLIAILLIVVLPKVFSKLSVFLLSFQKGVPTQEEETSILLPPLFDQADEATNSSRITLTGYANNAEKIDLFNNNLKKATIDVSPDGTFIFESVLLYNGVNTFYAVSYDSKGQESQKSESFKVKFSSDNPKLEVFTPEDMQEIHGQTNMFTITGFTDLENELKINGRPVLVASDGSFSYQIKLRDGNNTITVVAINPMGSRSELVRTVSYSQ
jgi:hypothetical protein